MDCKRIQKNITGGDGCTFGDILTKTVQENLCYEYCTCTCVVLDLIQNVFWDKWRKALINLIGIRSLFKEIYYRRDVKRK